MTPILKYILLTSLRDRLYLGLFVALVISFSISIFLGSTALIEKQQMITVYVAGSSRVVLTIGMILFVCLNVSRAFENKEVEFIISKPISRERFVLGYLLGFCAVAMLIMIPVLIAIFALSSANKLGLLIWSASLISELIIIISFALLASLILRNAFSAIFASFGFYILSRLMGFFLVAINIPQDLAQIKSHFFATMLKIFSVFFPRLDLFGQSSWLNYGITDFGNLKIIFWQSLIYIPLMIFMAFHDFKKKQF
jgi:ABC-type transport system involved in multi-copper enzyme maturation permease subunit